MAEYITSNGRNAATHASRDNSDKSIYFTAPTISFDDMSAREDFLLMLVSTLSGSVVQQKKQKRALTILQACGVQPEILDAADPSNALPATKTVIPSAASKDFFYKQGVRLYDDDGTETTHPETSHAGSSFDSYSVAHPPTPLRVHHNYDRMNSSEVHYEGEEEFDAQFRQEAVDSPERKLVETAGNADAFREGHEPEEEDTSVRSYKRLAPDAVTHLPLDIPGKTLYYFPRQAHHIKSIHLSIMEQYTRECKL
ncbi:hypothetical protein IV203_006767 [Nitzschia inconspicua]|uniref:Uncharacterized protein n=1 Tax=Nitzschia inconspicua TaxID=303405 RepID=A0A9K3K6L1_9STRA|nr:hypothetical protein IV203_006767 [Nitzschia inconspicua]